MSRLENDVQGSGGGYWTHAAGAGAVGEPGPADAFVVFVGDLFNGEHGCDVGSGPVAQRRSATPRRTKNHAKLDSRDFL